TPGAQTEASGARAPTGALYLGSMAALGEPALLRTHAIRHLVQVLDPSPMSYHRIDLADSTSAASAADLHAALPDACAYIAAALDKGENVLVHCHQGVSRSASIVIAFLIHDHHMSYDGAHALVRGRRLCVRPNKGFEGALREWEGECRE
ncbi:phosphatases II, partial [Mycena latifolia]